MNEEDAIVKTSSMNNKTPLFIMFYSAIVGLALTALALPTAIVEAVAMFCAILVVMSTSTLVLIMLADDLYYTLEDYRMRRALREWQAFQKSKLEAEKRRYVLSEGGYR